MGKLLSQPDVLVPYLLYCFYRIQDRIESRRNSGLVAPTFIGLPEVWGYLEEPIFARKLAEWIDTLRKLLGCVWMDAQSPERYINSPIYASIRDNVAPFKPAMVFDDGKFTWIQLPSDVQEIPAIFALGADGTAELVNFTVRRNYFVVQRLFPDGALLKLRKDEVRVFNRRGKACGLFGCGVSGVKNLNNASYQ